MQYGSNLSISMLNFDKFVWLLVHRGVGGNETAGEILCNEATDNLPYGSPNYLGKTRNETESEKPQEIYSTYHFVRLGFIYY